MNVLVLNSGSSSVKYELYDMERRLMRVGGAAERIGDAGSRVVHGHRDGQGRWQEQNVSLELPDHQSALQAIAGCLQQDGGVGPLHAIGHRVVHGGEVFWQPTRIDARVVDTIRRLSSLAPLHNPANLLGIQTALTWQPRVPQVAVFDTAFHHGIPAHAHRYAVPQAWYEEHGVRRYGFHGTSHAFVAKQAARFLERPLEALNMITLHLGNGASATAVQAGKSVDTSMGLTPLEGLVMGTRSGDVDAGLVFHVAREQGADLQALDRALNKGSGLLGLCGASDLRDVLRREAQGDEAAALALGVYVHRIRKYVGAYAAVMGRLDALVFTAGVGENSAEIRARVCRDLSLLGVELDTERNGAAGSATRAIGRPGSATAVLVVPTNEELEIADQTVACLMQKASQQA